MNQLSSSVTFLQENASFSSGEIERIEKKMDSFESKMDFWISVVTSEKGAPTQYMPHNDRVIDVECTVPRISTSSSRIDNGCVLVQEPSCHPDALPAFLPPFSNTPFTVH